MKRSPDPTLRVLIHIACLLGLLATSIARPAFALARTPQTTIISFGSTTTGSINQPGEVDTYTFSAQNGDRILIGMSRVSGDLWQRVRLYGPDGTLLQDESSPVHLEISLSLELPDRVNVFLPIIANNPTVSLNGFPPTDPVLQVPATTPGTYTIRVSDGFDGTLTGSYNLYLQKLNPPAGAGLIEFSQTLPGTINQPAEMDAFIFSAAAGDKLIAGMSRVSGNVWQQIRLYDSDGELLSETKSPIHTEMIYDMPAAGSYSLLVSDGFNGTLTGSYNLYIQRTNNPANAVTLSFGQTTPGSINQPAEMDAFTFTASANDQVQINMTRVSGSLWQQIRLYDPSGALLAENKAPTQAEITQVLLANGDYRILASDGFNGTLTGSYNINLQKLP